jgi:hypothetical protein
MIVKPLWPLWIFGLHTLLQQQRQIEASKYFVKNISDANRSKSKKSAYSSDCSLATREDEVGIASNRKILHYG